MMIVDMLGYYKMIKSFQIDIIYSGPLWSEQIESIGETLRKRMEFDELPLSASQSIFSVFVEQMNNMLMYSAEKQHFDLPDGKYLDISKGIFVLGTKKKTYFVQTGNIIKDEDAAFIKNRIDYLNTLDKAELRRYFKEQMKCGSSDTGCKDAGLGLIEVARRASSKIEYSFSPMENGLSFLSMLVKIGQEEN